MSKWRLGRKAETFRKGVLDSRFFSQMVCDLASTLLSQPKDVRAYRTHMNKTTLNLM